MRTALFVVLFFSATLPAQSSFRIFDEQMIDVTEGVLYLSDTNAAQIVARLTVENVDSIPRTITAGRLVLTQPSTASNAFTWGMYQYAPSNDTSMMAETILPSATDSFSGYYFPNNNGGIATINYCFWETTNMDNYSCVTVTFDNFFPAGISSPYYAIPLALFPNPAADIVGVGWSGPSYENVNLYSTSGTLIESRDVRNKGGCEFDLTNLPSGIYMINCTGTGEHTYSTKVLHLKEQ